MLYRQLKTATFSPSVEALKKSWKWWNEEKPFQNSCYGPFPFQRELENALCELTGIDSREDRADSIQQYKRAMELAVQSLLADMGVWTRSVLDGCEWFLMSHINWGSVVSHMWIFMNSETTCCKASWTGCCLGHCGNTLLLLLLLYCAPKLYMYHCKSCSAGGAGYSMACSTVWSM